MSAGRAFLIVALASLVAAGLLAFVSRSPEGLRTAEAPPEATDASNGASFTEQQIARHGAYRGPGYLFVVLVTALEVVVLIALSRGPFAALVHRFETWPGGWVTTAMAGAVALVVIMWFATLPVSFVRGFAMETAWGLSTQGAGGWLSDQLRATAIGAITAAIAATAFIGIVRWQPRTWWLIGWAAFTGLFALFTFLWPVLVAPLFNKFTPLGDPFLRERSLTLAREAGVEIDDVLVADASRRTSTENAYVSGIGSTKRLVVYDNLVENSDPRSAAFVIAHELGHRAKGHILKQIGISSVGLLIAFGILRYLAGKEALWSWAGADGIGDVRALPLLLLISLILGTLSLPLQNAVSRRFESEADRVAIDLTDDPDAGVRTFRRLAFSNLADLRPPGLAVDVLFTHPPVPDRIRSVLGSSSP